MHAPADLGYVAQDGGLDPEHTIARVLHDALAPLHAAVRELEELATGLEQPGAADRYDEVLAWATRHDAWTATARAERAAALLGLEHLPRDRPVGTLSGGQRGRLALAALLARRPDCVLLDEPTNHLSLGLVEELEAALLDAPATVCSWPATIGGCGRGGASRRCDWGRELVRQRELEPRSPDRLPHRRQISASPGPLNAPSRGVRRVATISSSSAGPRSSGPCPIARSASSATKRTLLASDFVPSKASGVRSW